MNARLERQGARRGPAHAPCASPAPATAPPALPPWALTIPVVVAAAVIVLAVSTRIGDPDLWQHLAVGRAIGQLHALPRTDLWTWPGYGSHYVLPSWLFRVLLWPFWSVGGIPGLFAWRWLAALATFALLWRTARRAGATGLAPLTMLVWCALFYRQRSMVRPDTLVGVLLALELLLLESRRAGARVHAAWLVPIAWLWVNAHVSYPLCFGVGLAYLADAIVRRHRSGPLSAESPRALGLALAASAGALFANPFGFEALRQPFDFALHGRHEPIFRAIWELQPLQWELNTANGLAPFLVLAALLAALRARREGVDVAQALVLLPMLAQALLSQRFLGLFGIAAAPFAARDLVHALARLRAPAWISAPAVRALAASGACVMLAVPELSQRALPLGIGLEPGAVPGAACDWIERHDVRGRAFNTFSQGGYLLWRFWPQRDRLPFMDVHQTGTRRDRDLYAGAWTDPLAWNALDAERRFDWALLVRRPREARGLLDHLDADSTWALVFADDAAALYLRRDGSMAALAARAAYVVTPAGTALLPRFAELVAHDSSFRAAARAELLRQVADSPLSGQANSQLANLDALEGRWGAALEHLRVARRIDAWLPQLDERERDALARQAAGGAR